MREYKKVIVPAKEQDKLICTKCDFCGKVAKGEGWDSSYYSNNETDIEVRIRHSEGNNYPSGGVGEKFKCDMCPECFRNKLIPFLQSVSQTKLEYEDWSY